MQRQKSILSFLRPPPDNQTSGADASPAKPSPEMQQKQTRFSSGKVFAGSSMIDLTDVAGTDTPPEKPPRRVFLIDELNGGGSGTSSSSSRFSSIMHKFVKCKDEEKAKGRDPTHVDLSPTYAKSFEVSKSMSFQYQMNGDVVKTTTVDRGECLHRENEIDNLGPETPGLKPAVPLLKRLQVDIPKFESKNDTCFPNPSKRIRLNQHSILSNNKEVDAMDTTSKFEWLHSSRIRDANRRGPDDPLYDKRTLYIPPEALNKMSATQKQYWTVKRQYMDIVLFFKVGKFYELYELDAETGHKELDWKITLSGVGKCRQVGISESGIDDAVQKLVARGYKVGVMEQAETADQAKARGGNSVISRKLVRVITPSTQVDGNIGVSAVHLLAIKEGVCEFDNGSICYGFAFVDCAALRFWVGSIKDDGSCSALGALLMQVAPKEIIYEGKGLSKEALKAIRKYSSSAGTISVQMTPVLPETGFAEASEVKSMIHSQGFFATSANLWSRAFDSIVHHDIALNALGGLISHLLRLKLDDVLRNADVLPYQVYKGCLRMDGQTMVNLEIFSNNADGGILGTLYHYLDNCLTSSGKRLLRNWICHPLKDIGAINDRLNVVEELLAQPEFMLLIAQNIRKLPDLERLLGRLKSSVQSSVSLFLPLIGSKILKQLVKVFGSLVKGLRTALDVLILLLKGGKLSSLITKVFEVPVVSGNEGLDKILSQFEAAIDSDFPNYQNHDVKDTDAQTLPILIELFVEKAADWVAVIHAINCIDVLRSFALTTNSSSGSVSRPIFLAQSGTTGTFQKAEGPLLRIMGLWHPFALGERGGLPVPNDIILGEDEDSYHARTLLLTGPNMGGKSTLLRATCLAIILAQLGCYVPCEKCTLTPVDIIFTRLGATDRIMSGESTFLVECTETASVLQNATEDSLVILDELGRGTSTFDGYAIAYAVLRHLVEKVNCRLLFATHYHPLTKEFGSHPRVMLQHMACAFQSQSGSCSRSDQELVFLYRLASGACPESYGLQVAMMAGIPEQVVKSASKAGQMIRKTVGESFRSSEQRLEFSTLHEMWLKQLFSVLHNGGHHVDDDDDALDTFFSLWHEMKSLNPFSHGLKSVR